MKRGATHLVYNSADVVSCILWNTYYLLFEALGISNLTTSKIGSLSAICFNLIRLYLCDIAQYHNILCNGLILHNTMILHKIAMSDNITIMLSYVWYCTLFFCVFCLIHKKLVICWCFVKLFITYWLLVHHFDRNLAL